MRVLRRLPGDSRCLTRSLVVLAMLARRGIEARLVLAARPTPTFTAHAWVERGGRPLLPTRDFEDARLAELMPRGLRAHEELVLLAAGTTARRSARAGRIGELLGQVEWDEVLAELALQRLVPLLGGRIVGFAGTRTPAAFAAAVQADTEASRRAGGLMELATLRLATALKAAGIANVPLKGPLLARSLHGDPGMHFSRDIDVLVARADLDARSPPSGRSARS